MLNALVHKWKDGLVTRFRLTENYSWLTKTEHTALGLIKPYYYLWFGFHAQTIPEAPRMVVPGLLALLLGIAAVELVIPRWTIRNRGKGLILESVAILLLLLLGRATPLDAVPILFPVVLEWYRRQQSVGAGLIRIASVFISLLVLDRLHVGIAIVNASATDWMPHPLLPLLAGLLVVIGEYQIRFQKEVAMTAHYRQTVAKMSADSIRLQNYTLRVQQMSVIQERIRVARDIHDSIGHLLVSMAVRIGVCEVKSTIEPDKITEDLVWLRETTAKTLQEVRNTVYDLRELAEIDERGRTRWTRMIQAFGEATSLDVQVDIQEDFANLASDIDETVYRVIQEALTNAVCHGHAIQARVRVWWYGGLLLIFISDVGDGTDTVQEGHGLRGMRERVEALGGQVEYRTEKDCGFDIGVEIPVKGGGYYANKNSRCG